MGITRKFWSPLQKVEKFSRRNGTYSQVLRKRIDYDVSPFRIDPLVKEHHDSTVFFRPYETTESLLQLDNHVGKRVFRKSISVELRSCDKHRISRNGKRKLMDDEQFQVLSGNIDSFPKTFRSEKNARIRMLQVLSKHLVLSSAHSLRKEPDSFRFQRSLQGQRRFFNSGKGGKKHERSATEQCNQIP